MKKLPKADLHDHAVFSCDREYLVRNGIAIPSNEKITKNILNHYKIPKTI